MTTLILIAALVFGILEGFLMWYFGLSFFQILAIFTVDFFYTTLFSAWRELRRTGVGLGDSDEP